MSRFCSLIIGCLLVCALGAAAGPAHATAPVPAGWPAHLLLGMSDAEHGAADLRATTPLEARYHYLSGGVNTGQGWTTWAEGNGSFVSTFIADSQASSFLPVFSLYQIRGSLPGSAQADEQSGDLQNLATTATMLQYFTQLKVFFQQAAPSGVPVVLHVEPDLWGYAERAATANGTGTAASVPAQVASTGMPELAGLPNTVAGFAQAIVRLRNDYAKNVELAYHVSIWGTGEDISLSDPGDAHIDELAGQAAAWYRSLGARFDLMFSEFADRDAGYAQAVDGNPAAWWTPDDYANNARFVGDLSTSLNLRDAVWQVPLGNKVMRAMNNTPFHWQDDRVQWLLGTGYKAHLRPFTAAGVIGFLFGPAQPTSTCACDQAVDGITNPAPIDGNNLASISADDDGGYFKSRAKAYYAAAPPSLPAAVKAPKKAKVRTKVPRLRVSTKMSRRSVARGKKITITTTVTAAGPATTLVAIQLYKPGARRETYQQPFRNQRLRTKVGRRLRWTFTVPATARRGTWRVKVGVFDPNWKTLYHWTESAASFAVR